MCKGAKADVVFLIDGSWSIGEESFSKVMHFVSGMIGAFDVIGPSGMQVGAGVGEGGGSIIDRCCLPSVTLHTGVVRPVQRRGKDGVQAERLPGQRRGHVCHASHPLPRREHQNRFDPPEPTAAGGSPDVSLTGFLLLGAGVALKHTYEKAFSLENGMRRNVPKVVVAITDGRSQDEVKKNAAKLQHAGKEVTCEDLCAPDGDCE